MWLVQEPSSRDCEVQTSTGLVGRWLWGSQVRPHPRVSGLQRECWGVGHIRTPWQWRSAGEEGRLLPQPLVSLLPSDLAPGHQ